MQKVSVIVSVSVSVFGWTDLNTAAIYKHTKVSGQFCKRFEMTHGI